MPATLLLLLLLLLSYLGLLSGFGAENVCFACYCIIERLPICYYTYLLLFIFNFINRLGLGLELEIGLGLRLGLLLVKGLTDDLVCLMDGKRLLFDN